ncbi:hypothetical protein [Hymenobacter jejuensis]|uniref:Uncharacterized protein n=1 Tax=Hymenobacter jejuensis TaxID=2502781 RepID=A0A5B8A365_9BACT|nr:hypothetical protein [Hymenobacter jejuensis]QDA61768.1 hypothetical protein FHG12_17440 [Hymenobacter jejuensis]
MNEHDVSHAVPSTEFLKWQQQLSDCQRANQQQDHLIFRLVQAPNAPPAQVMTVHCPLQNHIS